MRPLSLDQIIERIHAYAPGADMAPLSRAHAFSTAAHAGQKRRSGEPYIHHPLEVAGILAQLKLDLPSIVAGLLHDVVEDTPHTHDDIQADFGEEVASLVSGVTKIDRIVFRSNQEKQAENFRKMIVSMASDIRVLLIKLGDRLHNMRTLGALPDEKQRHIAQETLDIYAPLANRLGIGWIKSELEDHCLHYLHPDIYKDLAQKVARDQSRQERYIHTVIGILQKSMADDNLVGRVTGRSKHLFGVYQKMEKRGIPFEEVYDLRGVRIITQTKMHCYALLGLIHSLWMPVPGRFKDYIAIAKSNLYQSLHTTVVGPRGRNVEFQIRTEEMHKVAEEGVAAHWVYKEGKRVNPQDEKLFAWLRQLSEWQEEIANSRQFMESVRTDLFADVIYLFTPKGDVKEMMKGSTPIDFAYAVHTEVGNHCVGAKVDGRIVPLNYTLRNGDKVDILTSPSQRPGKDWLSIAKTAKAKTKIRHLLREAEQVSNLEIGKKIVERELRKAHLSPSAALKSDRMLAGVKEVGIHSMEALFMAVGYGKISAQQVIQPLLSEPHLKEGLKDKILKKVGIGQGHVVVKGLSDILVQISKCCNPVPGDRIIGFITRGRGVSIHTTECPNIDQLDYNEERIVEVGWDRKSQEAHPVNIHVATIDRPGLLASVSSAIATAASNIRQADIVTTEDKKGVLRFRIDIVDTQHLEKILKNIEKVDGVLSARRRRG